ncbi:unnamed protein product [Polarella glacialis]|uniref:Protein arginine N-methyltransferase domain-containing protein n=1 Tax=Polarella glacialis TaxID=89957 RepID=A0A813E995_POLGL|nr:unnamed protein product [Polarella glacialis]
MLGPARLAIFDPFLGGGSGGCGALSAGLATIRKLRSESTDAGPMLAADARLLPARVRIVGVMVESESILRRNNVSSQSGAECECLNLHGFVSRFQQDMCAVNLDDHSHKLLTAAAVLHVVDVDKATDPVFPVEAGVGETEVEVEVTIQGQLDCLVFWLDVSYCDEASSSENQGMPTLSSRPHSLTSNNNSNNRRSLPIQGGGQHAFYCRGQSIQQSALHCGQRLRVRTSLGCTGCPMFHVRSLGDDDATAMSELPQVYGEGHRYRPLAYHFPMLSDRTRNSTYDRAIRNAIEGFCEQHGRPPRVLDIGSGSGLLSMFAARAGATQVVALEAENELAEASISIIQSNNLSDRIRVIPRNSRELFAEDIGGRADLIVSEIFGDEALSEAVLPTLAHAAEHLLAEGGQFLPATCTVFAALAHCDSLNNLFEVSSLAGFDVSALNQLGSTQDSMRLNNLRGLSLCTEATAVARFNFNGRPIELECQFEETSFAKDDLPEDGIAANCIVHWFELGFDMGADKSDVLSTAPNSDSNCWKQGIVWLGDRTCLLQPGDSIRLQLHVELDRMTFSVPGQTEQQQQQQQQQQQELFQDRLKGP